MNCTSTNHGYGCRDRGTRYLLVRKHESFITYLCDYHARSILDWYWRCGWAVREEMEEAA